MKQNLFKFWLTMLCLIVGVGSMWAEMYTGTVSSSSGSVSTSFILNSVTWNIATTAGAGSPTKVYGNAYSNKCIKFGAGASNCYGSVSLSTSYFKDNNKKVTKVEINALGSAKKNVTFSVGASTITKEVAASSWTKLTLDNLNITETLQLNFSLNSAGFFINQIVVTYTDASESTLTTLSVPTNLSSSNVTTTSATLSWDEVANASSYTVKIGSTEYTGVKATSYNATGLSAGTQYTWTVKAVGDGSNYTTSAYAANANFTTENEQGGGSGEGGGSSSSTYTYKKVTSQSDIEYGGTYLIVCESNNTAMGSQSTNRRNSAGVIINNGIISLDNVNADGHPYEVTLGTNSEKYTMITSEGKYLGNGATSNNYLKEVQNCNDGYRWTLTYSNGNVIMTTDNSTARTLYVNTSNSDSYSTYSTKGSSYYDVTLYKKQTAPAGPAEIPNLIKTSSADLYVGDEIDNLKTYLNLPNDYEGSVTFSSEQDGTLVTLVDEMLSADAAGTATINVTAAANGNYLETTGTITLNISKKTPVIAWVNGTKESYTIFNGNDYEFTSYPTAYLTSSGPSTINYSISNDGIIIDGEPAWESAGTYVVTAQTAENDKYNASNVITYTINVVEPAITMNPESGTVSAENPTVTFTGNGVKIAYMDEDSNVEENAGTTISVDADKTETYTVSITDDADNIFDSNFDVYFLQDANLQFAAESQTVSMKAEPFAALALTKSTDASEVTYSLEIIGDEGKAIAEIDENGVITLSGTKATSDSRKVYVVATTPATENYAAGEARYQLIIEKLNPELAWSVENVTVDLDEEEKLPTLSNPRGLTINYDSSDKEVADFTDGILELKKAGTTTISASISSSAYYDATTVTYELTFAPTYTVIFNINGEETELREESCGAGVTAPEVENIADYTFAGWKTETVDTETSDTQTFVALADGKYMPTTANTHLYAVYQRTEEVEGGSSDEGEFLIYADVSETPYYMADKPTATGQEVNQITSTKERSSAKVFTITKNPEHENQYAISYEEDGTTYYLNCTKKTSGKNTNYYLQSSPVIYYFTRSEGENGSYRLTSTFSGQIIAYRASTYEVFKMFKSSNVAEGSTEYYDLELEQISGGSVTYYSSYPCYVSVSQYQNTTLCLDHGYKMPSGLVGKTVSAKEGSDGNYTLTLTTKYEEGAVVPAGEALVVQGAQGTYNAIAAASSEAKTAYPDNLLVAEYTPQDSKFLTSFDSENSDDYYYYKLTTKNGANFGWYYGAEGGAPFQMSSKERAYLVIAKDVAVGIRGFVLADMENNLVTDIHNMETIVPQEAIYNLQGQRVNRLQKGINIMGGKKVIR